MKVIKSPLYVDDLFEIWDYIAQDNQGAADRLHDEIEQVLYSLLDHPQLGPMCDFEPGLRRILIGQYILFYRVTPVAIEAVRVLHGARDIERLFD